MRLQNNKKTCFTNVTTTILFYYSIPPQADA